MTQQLEHKQYCMLGEHDECNCKNTWRIFDKEFNWDDKEKLKELESLHPDDLVEYILKTVDNVVKRSYSGDPNKQ